ncbi:hypothetical protein Efla_005858 [Eimeria flavescens]
MGVQVRASHSGPPICSFSRSGKLARMNEGSFARGYIRQMQRLEELERILRYLVDEIEEIAELSLSQLTAEMAEQQTLQQQQPYDTPGRFDYKHRLTSHDNTWCRFNLEASMDEVERSS